MSSRQKRKVARQNGAKAAGTKSPEGVQKSSQNALRHGLFADTLVLTNESKPHFHIMLQSYLQRFQPFDDVELHLVEEMVSARWRQQRIWMIQSAALDLQMDRDEQPIQETMLKCSEPTRISIAFSNLANNERTLDLLMRYETSYSRMHDRAMKTLQRLQQERVESDEIETPAAVAPTQPEEQKEPLPEHTKEQKQKLQNEPKSSLPVPPASQIPSQTTLRPLQM